MTINVSNKANAILVLLAAILLCWVGFYNGFPLVYSDTGTYINSGFKVYVPEDRPIFYGLFLRHVSLASSLFLVIFAQGLIVAYLIFKCFSAFFDNERRSIYFIATIGVLALCTGISHNVSILIPDIFSGIAVLAAMILLVHDRLSKTENVLISIILVFSLCAHLSNLLIFTLVVILVIARAFLQRNQGVFEKKIFKRALWLGGLSLFTWLFVPTFNYSINGHWETSAGSHVFVMGHLVETGLLKEYLHETCEGNETRLCALKDDPLWGFVWADQSPHTSDASWRTSREEYNEVIWGMLLNGKYFVRLIQKGLECGVKQFFQFDVEKRWPQAKTPPHQQIQWRFDDSEIEYLSSKQNQGHLDFELTNQIQFYLVISCLILLFYLVTVPSASASLAPELRWTLIFILLVVTISPFICANLSTINFRYQNRIIWLVPLGTMLYLCRLLEQRQKNASN